MTGKKLKEKIKLCGVSLRDVANMLGISEQNLQNKLNADDVKVSFLVELSRELNKDVYYFLDMQHPQKTSKPIVHPPQAPPPILVTTSAPLPSEREALLKEIVAEQAGTIAALNREIGALRHENGVLQRELAVCKKNLTELHAAALAAEEDARESSTADIIRYDPDSDYSSKLMAAEPQEPYTTAKRRSGKSPTVVTTLAHTGAVMPNTTHPNIVKKP